MSVQDRLQVVAGGTSGMGLETARFLGAYGPVLVGGRNEGRLKKAVDTLTAEGIQAYGKACDISDRKSVEAFAQYASGLGDIGSVVNAAGVFSDNSSVDLIAKVNVEGAINMTEVFYPLLADGVFVHFTSVTGYFYEPGEEELGVWATCNQPGFASRWRSAVDGSEDTDSQESRLPYYASSKRFLMYYTRANTSRFAERGNRIFSVAPGSYDTPMFQESDSTEDTIREAIPLRRVGHPAEMGLLVAQLVGPGHDYLTGTDVLADGGMHASMMTPQIP